MSQDDVLFVTSSRRSTMPEPDTIAATLTCAERGRSPRRGEVWRVYFADIGEAVTYCPECAERGFGVESS